MESSEHIKNFKGYATYQITVKGKIYPKFMNRLNNMEITHTETNGGTLSTLTGKIADQEALSGLLNILFDHRYPVISVLKIDSST